MKKLKTLAIVFALAAMVLHLGTTAQAAGEGSITILDTQNEYTYNVYKIFDLTASEDYTNVIYTVAEEWEDFFTTGDGADYLIAAAEATDAEKEALNRIVIDGKVYYLDITTTKEADDDEETGSVPSFATDALAYVIEEGIEPDAVATGDGEDVTITGLDLGYYLVYPYGATILNENSDGSIASLVSTLPDAEVVIKAEGIVIDKTVDDHSFDMSSIENPTYTVTGTVPDTTGYTSFTYELVDTMSEGLDFDGIESMTVVIGGVDITDTITEVSLTTHSTAVYNKDDEIIGYTCRLTSATAPYITLVYDTTSSRTARVIGYLLYLDMTDYQENVGETITITYSATVNEDGVAVVSTNEVQLRYSNDPFDDSSTDFEEDEEYVYSSKIIINKYDGDSEEPLDGAVFVLYKYDENSDEKVYYALTDEGEVEWVENIDDATPMTTDANGEAQFEGLKDGTYYLVETEAPDGYNVLDDEIEIEISAKLDNGAVVETSLTYTEDIENYSGTALPGTGGIGTTIFYVIGSILMLGAVVLLATRRLMNRQA